VTTRSAATLWLLLSAMAPACRRAPSLPEAAQTEASAAFHTGLAAMQTSQDALARQKLERVTQIAPHEPAAWANLGLLLMRQQQMDAAGVVLGKAAELAPRSAAIAKLRALYESRQGRLAEAIGLWKQAVSLDPNDLEAAFALAQDTQRQGAEGEAEAQRVLEALVTRSGNLAARLDLARLAAKRGDSEAFRRAVAPLPEASRTWPEEAKEQLRGVQGAAGGNPRAAATQVVFLKNVLLRSAEYRHALAAVSTPREEIGQPLARFMALPNPDPRPAAADEALSFSVEAVEAERHDTEQVAAAWLTGEGRPVVVSGVPADLNYDFRADLVVAGPKGTRVLMQQADGRFEDRLLLRAPAHAVWPADVDSEGDLDLLLARRDAGPLVLRNNGDGSFASLEPFAGVARLLDFAWADLDGEGVPDAALLDADGRGRVFLNQRGGAFREDSLPALPRAVAIAAASLGRGPGFDVLVLAVNGAVTRLSRDANGLWAAAEIARFAPAPAGARRLLVADLDNNGAPDLVAAGAAESRVLLGGPGGAFRPLAAALPFQARDVADLDGDGRLELLGSQRDGRAVAAKSRGSKSYRWQDVRLRASSGSGDQRVNSFGIGGEVELRAGLHAQRQSVAAPVVHFGLGVAERSDVIRILWPNGVLQSEFEQAADTTVAASQRLKGSCPWLFAWNGRAMGFVTDLIWRSPLGLRINAQATADVLMTEDWVKLRGTQLAPRDGAYDLRVTAELWETHFFDLVSLLVVDHPEGTEVFVDERFAVPPPKLGVVVTGPVRPLVAARDDAGRDVSERVATEDGRHLDFAGRGAYQGVTRDHFVELELPEDAPRRGPLWLVARGFVHPTDSSINVALSQGAHARPRGLSLQVADAAGRFREVRAGLGFPAGKEKTILLDLAGVLPARGTRLIRLATNLEVFWDHIGWAVGRPEVRVEPRRLELAVADLAWRGFSEMEPLVPGVPERPRYVLAGTAPRWLDLEGYHTRFGDVRELLLGVDDRYVIMNAGDEMRLRFAAEAPPAPGQTRDFVVVGDGWVKDGDYNTSFSRTVLPLPSHRSGRYDRAPQHLDDDPVYAARRDDFLTYHTRYVAPERARGALRGTIEAEGR